MMSSEAKSIAEAYLTARQGEPCLVIDWTVVETRTHWRFYWNSSAAAEGRAPALKGVAPVAVDKRTGVALLDPKARANEPLNGTFPPLPPGAEVSTEYAARAIAQGWLDATMEHWSSITSTRELPYGWAFFWQSDEFLRTGDVAHAYGGNGALIVMKSSGDLWMLGTALPVERMLADFECSRGLRPSTDS
jgi:hypothetical protein